MSFKHTFLDGSVIKTQDFTVKHYKTILKRCYGEINDHVEFVDDLVDTLAEFSDCERSWWGKKHLYDTALFLINLRSQYVGDVQQLGMKSGDKNISVDLSLPTMADKIKETFNTTFGKEVELGDECTGTLIPPTVDSVLQAVSWDPINFLHSVTIKGKTYMLDTQTRGILPAKIGKEVDLVVSRWVQIATDTNLLPEGCTEKLVFMPIPAVFSQLVKVLFMEDLEGFYSNIFHLARMANISPSYIENCAPGEYLLFVKKLEHMLAEQKQNNSSGQDLEVDAQGDEP